MSFNSDLEKRSISDVSLPEDIKPLLEQLIEKVGAMSQNGVRPEGRWQDDKICDEISPGCRVLDLGCGEAELLKRLIDENKIFGQGVELDREKVYQSIEKRVPVFQTDLDKGLSIFQDHSFDYVILEETLQTLKDPAMTVNEMMRIGKRGIVTFPNFGYWKVRFDLLFRGRMPMTDWLPSRWYDTPNIHLFTYDDFSRLIKEFEYEIESGFAMVNGEIVPIDEGSNFDAEELLLVIKKL